MSESQELDLRHGLEQVPLQPVFPREFNVDLETAGSMFRSGLVVLDQNRRIISANHFAREILDTGEALRIESDSAYAIGCSSTWKPGWQRAGYIRKTGPIANLDIIRDIHSRLDARDADVQFVKVKAHLVERTALLAGMLAATP